MLSQNFTASPNFWNSYNHEIFKARKNIFFRCAVIMPVALSIALVTLVSIIRIFSSEAIPLSGSVPSQFMPYNLGEEGVFAGANSMIFFNLSGLYNIVIVIGCAMLVGNEYRNGTIKMLVTREPSRNRLTLAKCLASATFVGIVALSFLVGWLVVALVFKPVNNLPLEITANDWDAIGKGLGYFGLKTLHTIVMVMLVVAVTFRFKSLVAGVITYFAYNGLDGYLSEMSAGLANNGVPAATADWFKPILEILRALNPFMLNTNFNRLTMTEQIWQISFSTREMVPQVNPKIVSGIPPVWSWLVIAVYLVAFTGMAVWIFSRRDITD